MTHTPLVADPADAAERAASPLVPGTGHHFARFYTLDETLVDSVAAYVTKNVAEGAAAIVIASEAHMSALQVRWASLQFDAAAAAARGQLLLLEAAETLSKFMVGGAPDRERFMASVGDVVARVSARYAHIAAFGEMVTLLWADGKPTAAVKLESLWDELMRSYPMTLFCGYALRDCAGEQSDEEFRAICAAHTHVIPAESYSPSSAEELRVTIAHLQRKALTLEMRLAQDSDIQRAMAHMAAIVENSDDAIVGKTLDGIIRSWNNGAQRLFGYTPEEAIGKPITLITPPERLEEEQRILATLRRGERIDHFETTRLTKDGRHVEISLTVSPVRDVSGVIIGASKIARDITDRKRAERLLREAVADLQLRTAELARFNEAAVGRESRILTLKHEVNELRARLGEPAEFSFDNVESNYRAPALAYSRKPAPAACERPTQELVPLESILLTEQLQQRGDRPPDYETEIKALAALVQALADSPDTIVQVLADEVLKRLRAGSAGLSLLTKDGQRFCWAAIAGEWSPHVGDGTPRDFGPCGDVIDRNAPQLFTHWERRYPYLAAATPLAEEGLLVPFYVDGKAVGTIWAIAHDLQRKFDAEDLRLLESLAHFASAAYQAVNMLGAAGERRAALSLLEDAVQARALAEKSLTKLRQSEQELRRNEEALRHADQRKDEFLALLAHELRNPLAPIRYALAANRKADWTAEQRRWADDVMERQVTHMSRLLDDLLDISRITRGTLELKKGPVELTSVLSTAIEAARPLLDARHHSLSIDFPREAVRLEADAVRLAQVFSNLLVNAAKYTDAHGRIELEARREAGEILVCVRDNGIGIAAEAMPRLFTMFVQAAGIQGRAEGGLGVGLALVRGIVALHGGTVHARSAGLGCGSEFTVRLPVGQLDLEATPLDSSASRTSAVGLRILVVDDNRDAANTCRALLETSGHHVQTAYTGREAFDLAAAFRPHAAILDIGLPDLDGYSLAKRIREATWGRRTLLIAVTGWGQTEDKRRSEEAGFDHHLAKPVAADELEQLILCAGS
jgi:PAS domain S-box-containing protein